MKSQVQPSFEGTESIVIPFPGQGADASSPRPADVLADVPRTETGRTYTFKEAAQLLQCGDESTLRNRYWKAKVEPAFRHCPQALRSIVGYDRNDQPVYRLNETGLEVLRAYLSAKFEGRESEFLMAARQQYPAPPIEPEAAPLMEPETAPSTPVTVDAGSPIVVSTPELPQAYSLNSLQGITALEFDDPLALADQIVQAVDHVQTAMQRDIDRKQQKLNDTRKAKDLVTAKVQELKLDQRFYQEKNTQISTAQTQDTQSLQDLATLLQGLGKPTTAPPAG